jgi:hypothetical protein
MKKILLCLLLAGCCKPVYITRCPAPEIIPVAAYRTDTLPDTPPPAEIVKAITEDLMQCQNTEARLRVILKGYEGIPK